MQKVFDEVGTLDKRCYELFSLTEDILMENAALSMATVIKNKFSKKSSLLIVVGSGNNGADGITLARILSNDYNVELYIAIELKSLMALAQIDRAKKVGVKIVNELQKSYDVIVEALFGSGFNRRLDRQMENLIDRLNQINGYKIACDFPTIPFRADITITMGALKKRLFEDSIKDYTGQILVGDLGISRDNYEIDTNFYLLDKGDMKLPFRKTLIAHKGTFGHLAVIIGEKRGAGILACEAGFAFGAGLVSAITNDTNLPLHIMQNEKLPTNTTAIAIGMGLGKDINENIFDNDIAKIIDADLFYDMKILKILKQKNIVITPHPKEFCSLYALCGLGAISINELQENRFKYVEKFSAKYPDVVLLLKGSNSLIAYQNTIYINPFGSSKLSFGGSGDVLSGLIGSLLAQRLSPLDSTITASLAHSFAAINYQGNDYSMKPQDLIEEIKKL